MSEEKKTDEIKNEEVAEVTETVAAVAPVKATVKIKNNMEAIENALLAEENNFDKFKVPFNVGDTVRVHVKIKEGVKERVQIYEGVVMGFNHGANRKSFLVRRVSYSVAVERVFPFHSPYIEKVEIVRKGLVRRAKLYYLRGKFGKAAKIKEKVSHKHLTK